MSPLPATLACLTVALLLTGCGGGGGQESSASSSTAASTNAESSPSGGSVSFGKPHPRATAATKAEREAAGRAASFVAPAGDNSVPTFGTEASAAERGEAEANLRAYLSARAAHDWGRACKLLSAAVVQGYEKLATSQGHAGCAKLLPVLAPFKAGEPANPLRGALLAFRVKGQNAFALFYGPPGHQAYIVPMNREAGAWRPTQATAIPYPPGAP
jgi:hypothetical protein